MSNFSSLLLQKLNWRYAVKKFDSSRKIPDDQWKVLEQTLILSPSSYGLQPWQFILVKDSALKKKLTPVSNDQAQVETCSHFVVMTSLTEMDEAYLDKHLNHMAAVRSMPQDSPSLVGYKKRMMDTFIHGPRQNIIPEWAARQVYIAMGVFLTSAALLDIDTCPMEGIDPKAYDEILGITGTKYRTLCAIAAGYRDPADKYAEAKKVRFDRSQMIKEI